MDKVLPCPSNPEWVRSTVTDKNIMLVLRGHRRKHYHYEIGSLVSWGQVPDGPHPQIKTPPRGGVFSFPVSLKSSGGYLRLFFGRLAQHVAAAPDRLDVVLAARGIGELFAQLADEDVDDLQFRLVHAAVEMIEEHLLGQRRAFAQAQELQHLVLLAGQVHPRRADLDGLG